MISGKITAHFGVEVLVRTAEGESIRSRVGRNSGHVVGDFVTILNDRLTRLERQNELRRQTPFGEQVLAANLTHVGIVVSCSPKTPDKFVDQVIVACRAQHIEPFLVVTKMDLPSAGEFFDQMHRTYSGAIKVLTGFDELKQFLHKDMTLILVGVSGAGKSTLMNQLVPGANQKIGDLSEHRKTGKHTTSGALMLELPNGGDLIDSAGIRDFSPVNLNESDLAYYFPGFEAFRNQPCKFRDCKHLSEPGCVVREKANARDYQRYLAFLEA